MTIIMEVFLIFYGRVAGAFKMFAVICFYSGFRKKHNGLPHDKIINSHLMFLIL